MKFTIGDAITWLGVVGTTLFVLGLALGAALEHHHDHKKDHR